MARRYRQRIGRTTVTCDRQGRYIVKSGGHVKGTHLSKTRAHEQARAIRRVQKKHIIRRAGGKVPRRISDRRLDNKYRYWSRKGR